MNWVDQHNILSLELKDDLTVKLIVIQSQASPKIDQIADDVELEVAVEDDQQLQSPA